MMFKECDKVKFGAEPEWSVKLGYPETFLNSLRWSPKRRIFVEKFGRSGELHPTYVDDAMFNHNIEFER